MKREDPSPTPVKGKVIKTFRPSSLGQKVNRNMIEVSLTKSRATRKRRTAPRATIGSGDRGAGDHQIRSIGGPSKGDPNLHKTQSRVRERTGKILNTQFVARMIDGDER